MNIKKIISILNYLSTKVNYLTKLKAVKLLYFADKEHLIRYGRFITGDFYKKLPYGPIPQQTLILIDDPNYIIFSRNLKNYLDENISFSDSRYRTISSKKKPDLEYISLSEIEILDEIIEKYKNLHPLQLADLSEKEYCFEHSEQLEIISIEKIIHDIPEEQKKELLEVNKEYIEEERILSAIFNI